MSSHYEAPIREPLVLGDKSYHDITVDIAKPIEGKANKNWYIAFTISLIAFLWGLGCITYTIGTGIGAWGLNKNIGWAWDITNFVWWVGIGHAGTLISAVLLLFRQRWRMAINRSCGSDDYICRIPSRSLSYYSHGASLGCLLGVAYSQPIWVFMGKL